MAEETPNLFRFAIINDNTPSLPQNIDDPTTLTPAQLVRMRERIRAELCRLRGPRAASNFKFAAGWVVKVFAYSLDLTSDFVPRPTYGAKFLDFALFIDRKEKDAEAEAVLDEEDHVP